MTETSPNEAVLDPLGDQDATSAQKTSRNRAKVGAARPSSLLYTYGPGAVMDLPQLTAMPAGLDDWDRIWDRRESVPTIHAPRLLAVVKNFLPGVTQLRPFPWAPSRSFADKEGEDLGVPARIFPQWLRCTGCNKLGPLSQFNYVNTNPFRPDEARFEHRKCPGPDGRIRKNPSQVVAARYLLACTDGHLDEFPYDWWVHQGQACSSGAEIRPLAMLERTVGKGASATIECKACGLRRPMNEAQGDAGRDKLPRCRGRHPHLAAFSKNGCVNQARVMLLGASNLWFPATQSVIVMPESETETVMTRGDELRAAIGPKKLEKYHADVDRIREELDDVESRLVDLSDDDLVAAIAASMAPPPSEEERQAELARFDPIDLLVPEWNYLQRDPAGAHHVDEQTGLALTGLGDLHRDLRELGVSRGLAVDSLRKVNALVGFTRIDEMERANDLPSRLVPLTRSARAEWAVATEDRGEGIFLQLDEARVAEWEAKIESTDLWEAHRASHQRNFDARFSETSKDVDADSRFMPARYWLAHTFGHLLIREMAMYSGYSAASLSERVYAWKATDERPAAAGLLIVTTASDSDGTLGGLVSLSERSSLNRIVDRALTRSHRCSSDPVCAQRVPKDPEDFLHGAACHTCAMASETSCERANRFLDRRLVVDLPGYGGYGFFS
ncbi:DrmB family protein [uncultured Demequina sp.]|uniref:DrmB family protein n=1 Tax=uncultured Demequina sp. TaxID=693499 RepID=UPI0025E801DD|nr:DrmB family protein [uncultured Demequina sp.]